MGNGYAQPIQPPRPAFCSLPAAVKAAEPNLRQKWAIPPGTRFTRWTILGFSHMQRSRALYSVRCDCGNERVVASSNLKMGKTKSCGCLARELRSARLTKPDNGSAITRIMLRYQHNAKDRGLCWELSRETVEILVRQPCHYCGIDAGNTGTAVRGFRHNGIDRVDNSQGYTNDNVVPCCGICNRCKNTLSKDEFLAWARNVAALHSGEAA